MKLEIKLLFIFKYENINKYYWIILFRKVKLRRLKILIYIFNNIRSGIKIFNKNTSQQLAVNIRNKIVKLYIIYE